MMSSFEYRRDSNGVCLRDTHGDVQKLAAEVGFMTHQIYSALMRQNPELGKAFRFFVVKGMLSGSPTWKLNKDGSGTEIVILTPKQKEEDA